MRHASLIVTASSAVLVAVCTLAACASEAEPVPQADDSNAADASTIPLPAEDAAPPPPKKCAPSCSTDDDCANSCPTPTTGRACCDVASGMCFSHNELTCPAPQPSSSSGGY